MYREYPVTDALARYVDCVWVLGAEPPAASPSMHRIFPDGSADIVVAGPDITAYGAATTVRLIPKGVAAWGVRLHPGAGTAVLGVSLAELQSHPVPLRHLWGHQGSLLEERLAAESTPANLTDILQQTLLRRLADAGNVDHAVLRVAKRLRRSPGTQVRQLARDACVCERQLRRRFERHVGMSKKQYARIARFQRLLDTVRRHRRRHGSVSPGWAALARDHGYADQAHLIREVRTLSGLTPADLLLSL